MPTIKVISGATAGEERELEDDLVIGRENADLLLPDSEVSRRHAVVRPAGGGVEIEDLGSRNGTFVDERRLASPTTLMASATLRIGETRLAVEIAEPDVTAMRAVVAEPDVTAKRDVVAQPEVTAKRDVVAQPEVTPKRDVGAQPDVTAKRDVVPQPEPTPAPPEPKKPQSVRQLLPFIIGGLLVAIAVAVALALLLG
jgi:predicted component of type VI protein secretion system